MRARNQALSIGILSLALGILIGLVTSHWLSPTTGPVESAISHGAPSESSSIQSKATQTSPTTEKRPEIEAEPVTISALDDELAAIEKMAYGSPAYYEKLTELIKKLKASDIALLAKEMAGRQNDPRGQFGFDLVMSLFAEQNPAAAWSFALQINSNSTRRNALARVASSVASKNPAQAFDLINRITNKGLRDQLRFEAIKAVAEMNPAQAFDLSLASGDLGENEINWIFYYWARRDFAAAKSAIGRLTGQSAEQARRRLLSAYTHLDPEAAWRYAQSLRLSGEGSEKPLVEVIQAWAENDPQAAVKAALSIQDAAARQSALSNAVNTWARDDFDSALKYALDIQDPTIRADILYGMTYEATENHQQLLDAVLNYMPSGDRFNVAVARLFDSWVKAEPAKAAAAVKLLPAGPILSEAAGSVASNWAKNSSNRREVLEWARQLPTGEARRHALRSTLTEWSDTNPQETLVALQLLDTQDRLEAIPGIAAGWSRTNPEAALQWAYTLTNPQERELMVHGSILQWSYKSPEAAAAYVDRNPDTHRFGAIQAVVDNWATKDAGAAGAWLKTQPSDKNRDGAVVSLSQKIFNEDPESAINWANKITNTSFRAQYVENLAREWMRQNPGAARNWISRSDLPVDARARLLQ